MNTITIIADDVTGTINPNIFGHFTEHLGAVIYDGIWVGPDSDVPNINGFRTGIIDRLKQINAPVVRWPGGCFAETYNWRDGIGPVAERPVTTNWWYGHDSRLESNEVGTAEFMAFCRAAGASPYLAANITSTTPLEIRNWVDYCTMPAGSSSLARIRGENGDREPFSVPFWGIGNENWGGGGNMTPEDYATEYRKYATLASNIPGDGRCFVACGPSGNDLDWTTRFFEKMRDRVKTPASLLQGFAAHYYCGTAGSATEFTRDQWYQLLWQGLRMEQLVVEQRAAMDVHDPERRIGLLVDEWGCWHHEGSGPSGGANLLEQQSTMRDALVAALTFNIFANHSDKVVMANIAQLVNNLQSLFLSRGPELIETPTFHVFDMYKGHQGGRTLRTLVECDDLEFTHDGRFRAGYDNDSDGIAAAVSGTQCVPALTCASSLTGRTLTVTVVNLRYADRAVARIVLRSVAAAGTARQAVLAAGDPHDHNTFEDPGTVGAVWSEMAVSGDQIQLEIPAASVVLLEVPLA